MYNKWKVSQVVFYLRWQCFNCFLLVKFMSDAEIKRLEEERRYLIQILDFHVKSDGTLGTTEEESEKHIDDILDRILEINQIIDP